jgi:hypothetical protein
VPLIPRERRAHTLENAIARFIGAVVAAKDMVKS